MDGKGIVGVAENMGIQSSDMSELGSNTIKSWSASTEEVTKAGEGAGVSITSSLIQPQAQLPEVASHTFSQPAERMSVSEELKKRDGCNQISSVLLMADEARPLIPWSHSSSSTVTPSAMALQSEQGFFQNSLALQSENRVQGPSETKTTDGAADSETEHSEVEEAM